MWISRSCSVLSATSRATTPSSARPITGSQSSVALVESWKRRAGSTVAPSLFRTLCHYRIAYRHYSTGPTIESSREHEPLRILFCGSDKLSISSLDKLNDERRANSGLVESIDVVCRPGKRVGRGLKTIREGMCSSLSGLHAGV